jgi:hypothetical protein
MQQKLGQRNVTAGRQREMECRDAGGMDEEYQPGGASKIYSE